MTTTYIRVKNVPKYRIEESSSYKYLYDMSGRKLGWYDKSIKKTFNSKGHAISSGDILMTLVND